MLYDFRSLKEMLGTSDKGVNYRFDAHYSVKTNYFTNNYNLNILFLLGMSSLN